MNLKFDLFRKEWRLDNVPHVSPLEGNIAFQLNCYSESQVTTDLVFLKKEFGVPLYIIIYLQILPGIIRQVEFII